MYLEPIFPIFLAIPVPAIIDRYISEARGYISFPIPVMREILVCRLPLQASLFRDAFIAKMLLPVKGTLGYREGSVTWSWYTYEITSASTSSQTPLRFLVIGGGPAGSYSATALAREGFNVVLLESIKFPRYHIGESLLPSVRPFLRFVEAENVVKGHGFTLKRGVATKLSPCKREGYSDFIAMGMEHGAWNVIRSEFDDMLLKYSESSGVSVFQEVKVTEIHFSSTDATRPVAASWTGVGGSEGKISFDYLVDASGRNGIMSTKYLQNRVLNKSLDNVAFWGYWTDTKCYMPGTTRENAIWLRIEEYYLSELKRAPGVIDLIANGKLRGAGEPRAIKVGNDQSYSASEYAGRWWVMRDVSFTDPFFSSGVHLAFTGALAAAVSISALIRGHVTEEDALAWHSSKIGTSYTRFLIVVLGTYKQMCNQEMPVMSDIDEDNFDRAFELIRPVIQGTADVGKKLTEDELERTMEFCRHVFSPTTPEMYESVAKSSTRVDSDLMSSTGAIMTPADLDKLLDPMDYESRLVISEINGRKAIHPMYDATFHFGHELLHGLRAVVERGSLGLAKGE
ncbi:putative halogenase [Mycena floridula]|nr:putative halogenase [Mycena floridula]